jgi:hypothetical protein
MISQLTKTTILALCLSSCAPDQEVSFWTKKGDTVLVHHVVPGKQDKLERLTSKPVDNKEATAFGAAKDQKFYQVASQSGPAPTPIPAKVSAKPKKDTKEDTKDKASLAEVTSKLDSLKKQINSLQKQVSAAGKKEASPAPVAQQEDESDTPRLSQ